VDIGRASKEKRGRRRKRTESERKVLSYDTETKRDKE
jgi:hypothetical protein